jgi:hypothetical protein
LLAAALLVVIGLVPVRARVGAAVAGALRTMKGRKTVEDRVAEYGKSVHGRLEPRFREIGIAYPPKSMTLVGLKQERILEVWVAPEAGEMRLLKRYPVLAASGRLGPKLKQGDEQVPEGLYRIESLNPNSLFHLSLRVNYPNAFDRAKGAQDGRTHLGSDIMIHGDAVSVGCIAIGDEAAEELFVLAAETGVDKISVILSPVDFRVRKLPPKVPPLPAWVSELYPQVEKALSGLRHGAESNSK